MMKQRADESRPIDGKRRSSLFLKVALVVMTGAAATSTVIAALYIPYLPVQPVCTEGRGNWVTYEGQMSRNFAPPYASLLRQYGLRIKFDPATYEIWIAPIDRDEGPFIRETMDAAEVMRYGEMHTRGPWILSNRGSHPRLTCAEVKRLAIVRSED